MLAAAAVLASPLWVPAQENVPANDTAALSQALIDPNTKPEARDDVARRLLVRIDPAARTVLRDTLTNAQQPAAQLAAVRALAGFPTADDSLIPALFSLLDPSAPRPVFEAAAEALTAFKTNGEVLNRLLTVAREGRDERLRIAAIRAAGTFADKRVPATLIPLIDPAAQPPNIIRAADAALSSLTGTTPGSMSLEQWRRWWEGQSGKSDTQFQADLMAARGLQLDTARTTLTELEGEVARLLSKQYNDAPRDQRPEVLLQLLRSSNGTVRANGCRLAAEAALLGEAQPQSIREQLRLLVGDPVPQVRRGAAGALAVINDSEALTPLLTQLNQEPDSTVRAAIAGALRPIGDVRAVPALLTLLNDPRIDTAQAAATALSEEQLGNRIRQTNPDLAEQAADTIWKTLQKRTSPVNNTDLRTDLVRGMTSLRSRAHAPQLTQLLGRGAEQPKVLRSLLTAVGALRNAELAGAVAAYTDYADDSGVRLAAVRALGQVADTFVFERRLGDRLDPAKEKDADVRNAAWKVLTDLFPRAPTNQLDFWNDKLRNQPSRRIVVLTELRNRARAEGDARLVAARSQQIGDAAFEAQLYDDAVTAYREALQYAIQNRLPEDLISESLLNALLRARKSNEAVNFAQTQIARNKELGGILLPAIRQEIDRLINEVKDLPGASQLVTLALQMNPKPLPQQLDQLQQQAEEIQRRSKEQNLLPDGRRNGSLTASLK